MSKGKDNLKASQYVFNVINLYHHRNIKLHPSYRTRNLIILFFPHHRQATIITIARPEVPVVKDSQRGLNATMSSFNTIPKTMKAIQIKEFNAPYAVSEVPVPTPKPYQVLVQIKAGGYCHTDCMAHENAFGSELPFIGSHEPAGIVVGMGSEVKHFKEGDRVGCINFDSCCGKSRLAIPNRT